ncbi:MAG: hypothetical protein M3367_15360 [Acidobacteriota bacterium]|nr:hypothetical protein [Acidobacteriota bacterium]
MDNVWDLSNPDLRIRGYSGADIIVAPGTDARTVLPDSAILNVKANQTNPDTLVEGGVAEFEIANPTIALKGSDTARAPYINVLVRTTGYANIRFRANVRDLSTVNDAVQQIAVQYRTSEELGDPFTDVPSAYIADATEGGTATKVTPIDVILPPEANNVPDLEIRVMTVNAVGEDEWVGIDDISVTGVLISTPTPTPTPVATPTPTPNPTPTPTPTPGGNVCTPTTTVTEGDLFPGGIPSFGVSSGPGSVTIDHVNAGTGTQSITVVGAPTNAVVNIPPFTAGTFNPVNVTFTTPNPGLAVDFTLRAASQFHAVFIRVRCAATTCTPTTTVTEGDLFPGGIPSFGVSSGIGTVTIDHVNAGTGTHSITVVGAPTNAVVNIPAFPAGTFNPVNVTFTTPNPALPTDFTLRAASQFHAVFIRVRCGT